jgi:hypothetical protein
MRAARRALAVVAVLALAACGGGLSGRYMYAPGYGFEFTGSEVISRVGGDIGRGTYTVSDGRVLVCFGPMCNEFTISGSCLVATDGARYCKEP